MSDDKAFLMQRALRIFAPRLLYSESLVREYQFALPRKWRFDYAWIRQSKIAVEIDGGQWTANGGRHNRDSDRDKINCAVALGWHVLRFSTQQLEKDPEGCVELLLCVYDGTNQLPERFRSVK